eukprot:GHVP01042799.1.p1 GENE.GHVP01042799.1~~GHVP01042799.1.p1  ORF type:complete len:308 (+),score=56.23 GHVP01042799.1:551-1474(+)
MEGNSCTEKVNLGYCFSKEEPCDETDDKKIFLEDNNQFAPRRSKAGRKPFSGVFGICRQDTRWIVPFLKSEGEIRHKVFNFSNKEEEAAALVQGKIFLRWVIANGVRAHTRDGEGLNESDLPPFSQKDDGELGEEKACLPKKPDDFRRTKKTIHPEQLHPFLPSLLPPPWIANAPQFMWGPMMIARMHWPLQSPFMNRQQLDYQADSPSFADYSPDDTPSVQDISMQCDNDSEENIEERSADLESEENENFLENDARGTSESCIKYPPDKNFPALVAVKGEIARNKKQRIQKRKKTEKKSKGSPSIK